jgi:preprotein translocase subunit SecG
MLTPKSPTGEETGHVEEIHGRPGLGAKLKAHLRRFWWLHVIIFVVCTLILVLCLLVPHEKVIEETG